MNPDLYIPVKTINTLSWLRSPNRLIHYGIEPKYEITITYDGKLDKENETIMDIEFINEYNIKAPRVTYITMVDLLIIARQIDIQNENTVLSTTLITELPIIYDKWPQYLEKMGSIIDKAMKYNAKNLIPPTVNIDTNPLRSLPMENIMSNDIIEGFPQTSNSAG